MSSGVANKCNRGRAYWAGKRFGMLTILPNMTKTNTGRSAYLAQCDCGSDPVIRQMGNLKRSTNASCGCALAQTQSLAKCPDGKIVADDPLYNVWSGMNERCRNAERYPNYAGRGIRVCDRWLDFKLFRIDVSPRPSIDHTLDRIDNDGNYEPGNCRWATYTEQGRNRSTNVLIIYNGVTNNLSKWAELTGLNRSSISGRLKRGWSISDALTRKPDKKQRVMVSP